MIFYNFGAKICLAWYTYNLDFNFSHMIKYKKKYKLHTYTGGSASVEVSRVQPLAGTGSRSLTIVIALRLTYMYRNELAVLLSCVYASLNSSMRHPPTLSIGTGLSSI